MENAPKIVKKYQPIIDWDSQSIKSIRHHLLDDKDFEKSVLEIVENGSRITTINMMGSCEQISNPNLYQGSDNIPCEKKIPQLDSSFCTRNAGTVQQVVVQDLVIIPTW